MLASTSSGTLGSRDRCFEPSAWMSEREFDGIYGQPGLPAAVTDFATWLVANYSGNRLLNMLLCDRGRLLVGFIVSYLDVLPLPGSNTTGVTVSGVQKLCLQTGVCSAGRAASVLAGMRFGGYVAPVRDEEDRRRRVLAPTSKLTDTQLESWSRQFASMARFLPNAAGVPRELRRASFRTGFLHALGVHFLDGFRLLDHVPVLAPLLDSNAAFLVLISLALPRMTGERDANEPVPLSVSALSRRFGVSRAHLRKLLAGAAAAGLISSRVPGVSGGEGVMVTPLLLEAILTFYAVLFILFHRCAGMAVRDEWRWQGTMMHPLSATDANACSAVIAPPTNRTGLAPCVRHPSPQERPS